jgi:hypothetical protein
MLKKNINLPNHTNEVAHTLIVQLKSNRVIFILREDDTDNEYIGCYTPYTHQPSYYPVDQFYEKICLIIDELNASAITLSGNDRIISFQLYSGCTIKLRKF